MGRARERLPSHGKQANPEDGVGVGGGGMRGGVLPYIGKIGMCGTKGYGF